MYYICLNMQVNDNRTQLRRTSNTNLCVQRKIKCQGAPWLKKRSGMARPNTPHFDCTLCLIIHV